MLQKLKKSTRNDFLTIPRTRKMPVPPSGWFFQYIGVITFNEACSQKGGNAPQAALFADFLKKFAKFLSECLEEEMNSKPIQECFYRDTFPLLICSLPPLNFYAGLYFKYFAFCILFLPLFFFCGDIWLHSLLVPL